VPGAIASIVGSNIAPILVRRVRPAYLVATGLALAAIGSGLLTQVGDSSLALVVIGNTLMSFGFGMTFTLTADMVVTAAPPERAGAASAISETGAEFGGALGIAVLGSIGMAVYRSQIAQNLPSGIPVEALAQAQETLGGAVEVAQGLSAELSAALLSAANLAFVQGIHVIALVGAVGFAVVAIVNVVLLRDVEIHTEEHDAALEGELVH
jgi:DHA2 family multidrug resistance protein-like MFS transporter